MPVPGNFEQFLERPFPPKTPLIENLLYARDRVMLAGRRRHGKTTFSVQLCWDAASGQLDMLGNLIPRPFRVLGIFLEDDAAELQGKFRAVKLDPRTTEGRLHIETREDFYRGNIPIDIAQAGFRDRLTALCDQHRPDLLLLDNLSFLIGADYNNPQKVHALMTFLAKVEMHYNTAVVIAAHPRKRGTDQKADPASLRTDPEAFFEQVMGTSHTINMTGSLWGLERNVQTNETYFLGGAQRTSSDYGSAQKIGLDNETGRYRLLGNTDERLGLVLTTIARATAWEKLPAGSFKYAAAEGVSNLTKGPFYTFWQALLRGKLIVPIVGGQPNLWQRAPGAPERAPMWAQCDRDT